MNLKVGTGGTLRVPYDFPRNGIRSYLVFAGMGLILIAGPLYNRGAPPRGAGIAGSRQPRPPTCIPGRCTDLTTSIRYHLVSLTTSIIAAATNVATMARRNSLMIGRAAGSVQIARQTCEHRRGEFMLVNLQCGFYTAITRMGLILAGTVEKRQPSRRVASGQEAPRGKGCSRAEPLEWEPKRKKARSTCILICGREFGPQWRTTPAHGGEKNVPGNTAKRTLNRC